MASGAAPPRSGAPLPGAGAPLPVQGGPAAPDPALQRLRDPVAREQCLVALRGDGGPGADPLALDLATYRGSPALAVVQPAADPARLVLTVVGPGCSTADPDVLLRTTVDRP